MTAEWMDESDCVGAWQNERLAAVVFPTADTVAQVRQLARVKGPQRLMLVINPQWQTGGQIVSDFGLVTLAAFIAHMLDLCMHPFSHAHTFQCLLACLLALRSKPGNTCILAAAEAEYYLHWKML